MSLCAFLPLWQVAILLELDISITKGTKIRKAYQHLAMVYPNKTIPRFYLTFATYILNIMNKNFSERIGSELQEIEAAGLYKVERVISSDQGPEIAVNGKMVLNFCANNYLGLSSHPKVMKLPKNTLT